MSVFKGIVFSMVSTLIGLFILSNTVWASSCNTICYPGQNGVQICQTHCFNDGE